MAIDMRIEQDSIGTLEVPRDAYYGVQALRGAWNFCITGRGMRPEFIKNIAIIKKAAATLNGRIGAIDKKIADAISLACDEIISGSLHEYFICDSIQGGAGTSTNMNANEVIANRAIEILGGELGDYSIVHPNDHVNYGQSTNDVIPTAGKMTASALLSPLYIGLDRLARAFDDKAQEFDGIIKMGRTQLEDAVPIRLGQEFFAYSAVIRRDIRRIKAAEREMHVLNIGGSAIGTSLNVHPDYISDIANVITEFSGTEYTLAEDLIDATQNLDGFVSLSSALKTCAVNLSKIANDLRLLASGPRCGLGEINLPAKQNGSSIMPGKINPVIPEVVNQVAFLVIGHDATITMAAEAGQLELNAFEPVIFYQLFESITAMSGAVDTFVSNCVLGITANEHICRENVEKSTGIVTALAPIIGYKRSAEIAKKSLRLGVNITDIIIKENIMDKEELKSILDPYKMTGK